MSTVRGTLTYQNKPAAQLLTAASLFFADSNAHLAAIADDILTAMTVDNRNKLNGESDFVLATTEDMTGTYDAWCQVHFTDGTIGFVRINNVDASKTAADIASALIPGLGLTNGIRNAAGAYADKLVKLEQVNFRA